MMIGPYPLDLLALQLVTGVALGAIYVLVGIGLSLIFGLMTIVNFAHGAFFMAGAYVGVFLYGYTGNFWVSLVAAPLAVGALGLLVERLLVRRLYGRGIDDPLLLTFGLSYVIVESVRILFGLTGIPFGAPPALRGAVDIGIGYFPLYRLFLIVFTALVVAALWLFVERTSFGLIIRAGARDRQIVQVLGIDVSKVWLVVFALGCGLAGLAGILAAPLQGVTPEMGIPVLAEAFVVTVVGGMGSLAGAVLAGLLVGIVVAMTSLIAPDMTKMAIFALMALVLLVRPRGLLGRAGALG
ncbi:branched-chain amino acid ABC transporter permease [Methylobacterium isbiliense]|jgi:branched-chain amino acid transport system permease protein|uniref:High-affinity branched-chain amino acid transport system permease protein LivH n=1 Tax=Methylobacterium isbiliense TaxID=315478 RepID=A0ABQ4SMN4_9HYPH|nr:branched-chain amino acid ABC transporter permease [Methylobacterium isbiliense]MDN3626696.1 branched-chain amino acid ABC transporter permease [Methylobacterium isbiliense]GJE03799.1 High-affinity branched-chain amino acid transport system permease protein LivH [Methylobacterium isbiliense]